MPLRPQTPPTTSRFSYSFAYRSVQEEQEEIHFVSLALPSSQTFLLCSPRIYTKPGIHSNSINNLERPTCSSDLIFCQAHFAGQSGSVWAAAFIDCSLLGSFHSHNSPLAGAHPKPLHQQQLAEFAEARQQSHCTVTEPVPPSEQLQPLPGDERRWLCCKYFPRQRQTLLPAADSITFFLHLGGFVFCFVLWGGGGRAKTDFTIVRAASLCSQAEF